MRNIIKEAFGTAMEKAGFQKKSDCWYLRTQDAVLVANLQKSDYGDQYYVNLAVWLKALGDSTFPKEHHCHIRLRAVALDRDRQEYWEREVFNLENKDIQDPVRSELVQSFLVTRAIPFLLSCGSLAGLKRLQREGRFRGAFVGVEAQRALGGPD
jgi:hypothetical protein